MSFRPVNDASSQALVSDNNASVSVSGSALSALNRPLVPSRDRSSQDRAINNNNHNNNSSSTTSTTSTSNNTAGSYPLPKQMSPNSDSQATAVSSSSTDSNRVFTPPIIERTASSGQGSSQESQLLHLSQLAAAREKMPDVASGAGAGARSVKRTADGAVKDSRTSPAVSPPRPSSHSRNTSGISLASTASSRATELSSELKARLSYAMLKVNNGWQSRTIDEVENLASRAGSPASSNSTIPGTVGSSASPQTQTSHRPTPPQTTHPSVISNRPTDGAWRSSSTSPRLTSAPVGVPTRFQEEPSLGPPVSIQPDRGEISTRRNSNPKYSPAFLAPRSHHDSPHTPSVPSLHITSDNRNLRAVAEPMVISPTHNNREKDAMEALLFMSSPGNSANMKNHYASSQPVSHLRNGALFAPSSQRTALPTSAPKRKSLPSGRPAPSSQPLPAGHSPRKRVGFGRSPSAFSEMDLDDPVSPRRHDAYVRPAAPVGQKVNGHGATAPGKSLPLTGGLSRPARPRPRLSYEGLDEVLDRMATEDSSSESDGEIELPSVRRDQSGMRI